MEKTFKERLKDAIKSSMGLKLVITLSGWIIVLMLAGTFFVGRMMLDTQERHSRQRGRDVGAVLAKAALDRDSVGRHPRPEPPRGGRGQGKDILAVVFTNTRGRTAHQRARKFQRRGTKT